MAITDFLKTEHPPEDLAAALRVLRSFKGCEDERESDTLRYIAQEEARAAGRLEEWLQEQKTAKEGPPDAK